MDFYKFDKEISKALYDGRPEKDKLLELQVSSSLRWQAFTARLQLQKKIPEPKNLALAPK